MASKWIEQGWVSTNDLLLLGWSKDSVAALKVAVLERNVNLGGMSKARDLNEVNSWARNNGEPIVSSKAVRERERRSTRTGRKPVTGTGFRGSSQTTGLSQKPPPPSPAAFQAAQADAAKQAAQAAHRQKRTVQSFQAQTAGSWFESKRDANDAGFLSAVDLKDRLWTDTLMGKLLGEPDGLGHNYYNPSTPVRYWTKDHVLNVEASADFSNAVATSLSRRKIQWETGLDAIVKSNQDHGLSGRLSTLPWSLALAALLRPKD